MDNTGQAITAAGEGRAFLIEWKGERLDALAVIRRGKVAFRTADNRMLGRATVIGQLTRPGETGPAALAEQHPVWPIEAAEPAPPAPQEAPASDGQAPAGGTGAHWAESAPVIGTTAAQPPAPAPSPVPASEAGAEPALPEVRLVDGQWVAANPDGSTDIVWAGPIRVAAVDRELSAVQLRLDRLRAVRAAVSTEREVAIAEAIGRLAAADGVTEPHTADPAQQATWRRYAEVLVGE